MLRPFSQSLFPTRTGHSRREEKVTVRRRILVIAVSFKLAILSLPCSSIARQPGEISQIGILSSGPPAVVAGFRQGLRDLVYVEKKITSSRTASTEADRLDDPAACAGERG
jgi:hypothetical protein